ncbi:MAG: glycoside hydrolase family 3 C-terminal domain-containing protein [Clostridia bacterium]|nr:glycoside hydrolase family 3 C-terminal domain-containing protein [Clostridia bacterium]
MKGKNVNGKEDADLLQQKIKLLTGKDFWNTQSYPELGAASVKFSDGPHGLRLQRGAYDNFGIKKSVPATCFAESSSLACSWDEDLLYGQGLRLGREAAYFGVNVLLGPSVNIKRNPENGRNFEYFSEDPFLTGRLASAYIKGVQNNGVSCCVKHYAANNREFARTVCNSVLSRRALREVYLYPFEECVKRGEVGAVMTAYNKVNGVHCSENGQLISGILRGEWGFDGLVVSDWAGTYDRAAGIRAGEDIEMPRCALSYDETEKALQSGSLSEGDIDACVQRIADFSQKWRGTAAECDFAEHSDFVEKCAENSIVLLKNDGVLPLKRTQKVAVVGAFAQEYHFQGGGSARVNSNVDCNILGCLQQELTVIGYEKGFNTSGKYSKGLLKRALKLCSGADTVICFVGQSYLQDTEGADKSGISLPLCQTELVTRLAKTGKKVVVVLSCGSAVDTSWDRDVNALLQAGLFGQSGGKALAQILSGKVNPSGKLAESYPQSYADVPCASSFGKDPYKEVYKEDVFVGYRWYDAAGISPKYPFGYGLSYTNFEYYGMRATEEGVSFAIKNSGRADGAEVAEVYIAFPDCGFAQPEKVLKGFKKVYIRSGESVKIFIPFDENTFRTYDDRLNKWRIFAGEYKILVGSSSRDIRLECTLELQGYVPESGGNDKKAKIISSVLTDAESPSDKAATEDGYTEITLLTPFAALRRARGLAGRLLYRVGCRICSSKKNPSLKTLSYLYMRSVAQYARFNGVQTEGLLLACNGHFFKGLKKIIFKK